MEKQRGNRRIKKKKKNKKKTPTILRLRLGITKENPLPKTEKLGCNSLHTEPVLQLTSQKDTETTWNHYLETSPNTSHYMEAVFSMIRKIFVRNPGDPMKGLNVNLAILKIFLHITLRAAVHLGKDFEVN